MSRVVLKFRRFLVKSHKIWNSHFVNIIHDIRSKLGMYARNAISLMVLVKKCPGAYSTQ